MKSEKKKRRFSATAKSLEHLRSRGWTACVVEQTINMGPGKGVFKRDAFGFGDLLACKPHELPTLGPSPRGDIALIQTTTGAHAADRIAKILSLPAARVWLESGGLIVCHSWRKLKVFRGSKAFVWTLDERPVTLADFPPQESEMAGVETVPV